MKPSVFLLTLIATGSALAQTAGPESAPVTSTAVEVPKIAPIKNPFGPTAAKIRDIRQQSVDRAPASQLSENAAPADSEVLELPKMTVKQQPKPRPRLNASDTRAVMLGPKAFNDELAKKMTSGFDRALNKFSWLGGQSAAERAREEYNIQQKRQFLDDVLTISRAAEVTDPANAKALRDAAGKP
jgi:hypothetical protein